MFQERGLYIPIHHSEPELIIIPETPLGEQILFEAMKWPGAPSLKAVPENGREYGTNPCAEGVDCSGFVTFVLRNIGLDNPAIRYANEYADGYGVVVHEEYVQPGDLVIFSKRGIMPTHIGIALDETYMIHAPGEDGTHVGIRDWLRDAPTETGEGVIYSRNPIMIKRAAKKVGRWHVL